MSEWQRGTIGELAKGYRGVTYSAGQLRDFKAHDTITLLRSNNISGGQLDFEDVQIVPERLVNDDQLLTPGDIAVCMSNGSKALVGKSAQFTVTSDERFTVGAFCSVFRPHPSANSRFVAYVFQSSSYRSNLDLALAGTAINNLRNADIEAFSCYIPPYEEQSRIAQILSTLDSAICETEALIVKLKAVKQGLLRDLLTRGIDTNGKLRPPQSEAPQLYKESPLGRIPREWECMTVSAIADVKSGATPSRTIAHLFYAAIGIKWVKTLDLNEELIYETNEQITEQGLRGSSCVEYPAGTVLVAMYGGWEQIGRTGLLAVKAATNQAISALLFKTGSIFPEFILRALQHGRPRWQHVAASTRKDPNITKSDVMDFLLPIPSKPEQEMIAGRFRLVLEQLRFAQQQHLKLKQKKLGLMDDLLTGRVRVTPLLESMQKAAAPKEA